MSLDHNKKPVLTIILPCLNEENSISFCLDQIYSLRNKLPSFELIVVDNDSDDNSYQIIKNKSFSFSEIKLIKEAKRGYGSAYQAGFALAQGSYVFMTDADGSYDFFEIVNFIKELDNGADLVMGNRFSGGMKKGSMPFLHRYFGNPILSYLVRLFFKVKIKDVHCGSRAITLESYKKLKLQTSGMEFASEMIIKASRNKLKIKELAISYNPRLGASKLNSFRDGWRHLRFILLYSPLLLFLLPGLIFFITGLSLMFLFYFFDPSFFGLKFDFHPFFIFSALTLIGYQLIIFAAFSKVYAINHLGDKDLRIEKMFKKLTIEKIAPLGILVALIALTIFIFIFLNWIRNDAGLFNQVKNSLVALTLMVIGVETFFSSFIFSIIGIEKK
ncbi:glycosyltransferase family 2 protein [Patescibacteria group bacterium]|nr:glycosyltransferase family 2 protein [Patescibacteria group bacterium]